MSRNLQTEIGLLRQEVSYLTKLVEGMRRDIPDRLSPYSNRVMNESQAARYLGTSPQSVRGRREAGKLSARKEGRHWMYKEKELAQYKAKNTLPKIWKK